MSRQPCRIAILGRPNVGKSTLFNRLIGRRRALVHDEPGVTRDRIEESTIWWVKGKSFPVRVMDTGGLGGDQFAQEIVQQVEIALQSADVVLFVLDSQTGLLPLDEDLLRGLKRSGVFSRIPVLGIVNKVDAEVHENRIADFFHLEFSELLTLSAEQGRGISDLQEAIAQVAPNPADDSAQDFEDMSSDTSEVKPAGRIAIVGRPNVGKSTLMNAILGEQRMITSSIAGTTVDSIDSEVILGGRSFIFIDTAGIRRKSRTEQGVEVLSVVQTRKALEKADIALLILDGEKGICDQDEKIGGVIEEVGCSVILVINKWDTQKENRKFTRELAAERIRTKMAYLKYAPMLFVSALENEGLDRLGELIEEVLHQRKLKIPTREFTEWIREKTNFHNPMNAKFYMCHQSGRNPPTFVCHVNDSKKIHFSLKRHLVNTLREKWGYMGSPIRLLFVEGHDRHRSPNK